MMNRNHNNPDLEKYLLKCELLWRRDHAPKGECLNWLAPHCDTLQDIAAYLREIGFRIKKIMDETTSWGDEMKWVETTNGIIVYKNSEITQGLYARAYSYKGEE